MRPTVDGNVYRLLLYARRHRGRITTDVDVATDHMFDLARCFRVARPYLFRALHRIGIGSLRVESTIGCYVPVRVRCISTVL